MRLAVLLAVLGSIPALSAGVIPKGSSVFFLDTPRGPAWRLLLDFRFAKVPLHIVHRSEDAEYFLRVSYGPNRISTPDGRFVPVSVTLEVIDAEDDQVVWSNTASRKPGWVVHLPERPPTYAVMRSLREAMGE